MQIDLALYLRLARTFERSSAHVASLDERQARILRSLDRFLVAMQEQADVLANRQVVVPDIPVLLGEATSETITGEAIADFIAVEDSPGEWVKDYDLLYEDVMWLFKMQDFAGALCSVSRLINLAADTQELRQFLELNESKLVSAYERALGPFDNAISCSAASLDQYYFCNPDEAEIVLDIARSSDNVRQILNESPIGTLPTLSLIYRLRNEHIITIEGMEMPNALPGA